MADIKKISIAGTQYDVKDSNALPKSDQGNFLPNFDAMTPVQTVEFDTSDTNWHTIMTRTNTDASMADVNDIIYFRITVTGTSINQVVDCSLQYNAKIGQIPTFISFNRSGATDGNYTGVRYIRLVYPKTLNNGYNYAVEVTHNVNSNARHYKIEVYKTNSKVSWVQGTAVTYNSTYHNASQLTLHTDAGLMIAYAYGTIRQSNYATQVNGRVGKYINSTIQTAGAALLAASFVYQNGNKVYPASDKTKAIETGFGLQWNNSAYNSGNGVGWEQICQKAAIGNLTNVPHATIARGNPCYFRCTTDSSGNIYSDNYVATSMSAGYTWYYIGVAQSSTAIALDTTQSIFMTLDSDGKLTHVNGKEISAAISGLTASKALVSDANGGITTSAATSTEVGYLSGVTSAIQTQINGKQATITGGATTITGSNLTASRALVSNSSGKVAVSSVTSTELGYLSGVTSAVQTQLNNKSPLASPAFTGNPTVPTPATADNSQKIANTAWVNANASFGAAPRDVTELYDYGYAQVTSNISITLSESWKNFDEIVVVASFSSKDRIEPKRYSTYWLELMLQEGNPCIWENGISDYLQVAGYNESTPSTDTVFKVNGHVYCYLGKIYGVNRKS